MGVKILSTFPLTLTLSLSGRGNNSDAIHPRGKPRGTLAKESRKDKLMHFPSSYIIVICSSLRSETNMCPGAWVITSGRGVDTAARAEVTPQAQKTGISSDCIVTGSPKSGRSRSLIPISFGSPI